MTDALRPASLVCWNPSCEARSALVCIPWAGAGAAPFRRWAHVIGECARIYGARLAGREARIRERPATELGIVIAELAEAITRLPEERIDLFGHCSGAIIAFEVARTLRDTAVPALQGLIVAGQIAPRRLAESASTGYDPRRYISENLRGDAELMSLVVSVMEADLDAFKRYTYVPGDPLELPITAIRGGRDAYVSDADLAAWSEETTGLLTQRRVDNADHLFSSDVWWLSLAGEVLQALRLGINAEHRGRGTP
jgi:surfactin synthase thioesterase subunit